MAPVKRGGSNSAAEQKEAPEAAEREKTAGSEIQPSSKKQRLQQLQELSKQLQLKKKKQRPEAQEAAAEDGEDDAEASRQNAANPQQIGKRQQSDKKLKKQVHLPKKQVPLPKKRKLKQDAEGGDAAAISSDDNDAKKSKAVESEPNSDDPVSLQKKASTNQSLEAIEQKHSGKTQTQNSDQNWGGAKKNQAATKWTVVKGDDGKVINQMKGGGEINEEKESDDSDNKDQIMRDNKKDLDVKGSEQCTPQLWELLRRVNNNPDAFSRNLVDKGKLGNATTLPTLSSSSSSSSQLLPGLEAATAAAAEHAKVSPFMSSLANMKTGEQRPIFKLSPNRETAMGMKNSHQQSSTTSSEKLIQMLIQQHPRSNLPNNRSLFQMPQKQQIGNSLADAQRVSLESLTRLIQSRAQSQQQQQQQQQKSVDLQKTKSFPDVSSKLPSDGSLSKLSTLAFLSQMMEALPEKNSAKKPEADAGKPVFPDPSAIKMKNLTLQNSSHEVAEPSTSHHLSFSPWKAISSQIPGAKGSTNSKNIYVESHSLDIPVYYSYASFRTAYLVLLFEDEAPDRIIVQVTGATRIKKPSSKTLDDALLNVNLEWIYAPEYKRYMLSPQPPSGIPNVIKTSGTKASKISVSGNRILIELIIMPTNIILFRPEQGLNNEFNLILHCKFKDGTITSLHVDKPMRLCSKRHGRKSDTPLHDSVRHDKFRNTIKELIESSNKTKRTTPVTTPVATTESSSQPMQSAQ